MTRLPSLPTALRTLCMCFALLFARDTHGVLSGGAVARITSSMLKQLVITDSIMATEAVRVSRNLRVISIAPLVGEAIGRTSREESVSSLFH